MASLRIRVDGTEAEDVGKAKKLGPTENVKRVALIDLQNRGVVGRIVAGKNAAQKEVKDVKTEKTRVETQWRKAGIPAANQKVSENNALATSKGGVVGVAGRKIVTRSNSVRVGGGTSKTWSSQCLPQNNTNTKTLTAKVVEKNVQHVKYINISKTKIKEDKTTIAVPTIEPTLRREDSNLSLKSLSKFKAAISSTRTADLISKATATAKTSATATTKAATTAITKAEAADVYSGPYAVIKQKVSPEPKTIKQVESSDLKIVSVQTHSAELLKDVEDIDAGDSDNLVLVSEYVNDIYNYLYSLEVIHSVRQNHLDEQKEIYPKMRAVLIDWINEVHLQFHLVAETFQMAVAIIDRYLQQVKNTQRSQLQLVGVTALFIAAKYEELYPPALEDFVYITDDTYTAKQIIQMEIKIIKQLDFNLSRPVPLHFLRRFSKAANAEDSHHAMSKYFVELSLIEYNLVHYKPSEIAAASLFLSLHLLNGNSSCDTGFDNTHWTRTLEWYSRYSPDHLQPIAKQIATIAHNAPSAKLKAVYQKYQSSSLLKISLRPELSSVLMKSIINSKEE